MTTTDEHIEELQKELEDSKKYPLKLSWKMIWIIITTVATIISGAFGIGVKVETEAGKIKLYNQEIDYKKLLSQKEEQIIESNRKLKEATEENIFLTNRYVLYKERLTKCLDNCNFFMDKEQ